MTYPIAGPADQGEAARAERCDAVSSEVTVFDLHALSASVESDRILQLHFRRPVTDGDRKWLVDAINAKILADRAALTHPPQDAWKQQAADWLEQKADMETNSLHCGDNAITVQATHNFAISLKQAARTLRAALEASK